MIKKAVYDSLLNIFSTAIPLIFLQIISYPLMSKTLGVYSFGNVISLITFVLMFAEPVGSALNQTRLLVSNQYRSNDNNSDFSIILIKYSVVFAIIIFLTLPFLNYSISLLDYLMLFIVVIITIFRTYIMVEFRLKLDFKKIFSSNFILMLGYAAGTTVFLLLNYWLFIYIFGLISSLIYVLFNTSIWKTKLRKSENYKAVLKKTSILLLSTLLIYLLSYFDKFLIYPILGDESVAIYYGATVVGKFITMGLAPISGVMFTYLIKIGSIKLKHFNIFLGILILIVFLGYFITLFIGRYIVIWLYPDFGRDSINLLQYTTGTAMLNVLVTFINPFVIRYRNVIYQLIISIISIAFQITLGISFSYYFGIKGFAIGILIAVLFRFIITYVVFVSGYKKNL